MPDAEQPIAQGFDTQFLSGHALPVPTPTSPEVTADLQKTKDGAVVRHCTHFSLSMSASRKLCRWVAWNIDAGSHRVTTSDARHFTADPDYDADEQVGGRLYVGDDFDQGHVAAFADVSWGSDEEAARARTESCYYSNITPQLDSFNRSSMKGVWGRLENEIAKEADLEDDRLSVFGGPVFAADDPPYKGTVVPRQFWKIVAYVERSTLRAKGFVLTQPPLDTALRGLVLADFQVFQHRVADIATEIELDLDALVAADTAPAPASSERRLLAPTPLGRPVRTIADVMADGW